MKSKWLALGLIALVAACDSTSDPGPETFTATLSGANERPTPNVSPAVGTP